MSSEKYWFPARRYGWGWGLPNKWQGWVVYGLFAAALVAGPFLFSPIGRPIAFHAYMLSAAALLFLICWLKGEPPRWRWGR
jgi:hypothetical protein